jgi:deaminated glutathione amidase
MTRIAAIQMCSSENIDDNLKTAKQLIEEAASHGAKLIVLPEMFAIFGTDATDKVNAKEIFHEGKIQDFLSTLAKANGVWIVGGTIPIATENSQKIRAASLVFDHEGNIVARYDKIHLFDVTVSDTEAYQESATTEPGEKIVLVDTPFGKLGLSVCYDVRFPELYRCLFNAGADIIAIPAAFTVKTGEAHWELLTRARAVENFCYVIGAAQGGTHANGRQTFGHSLIIDPWGTVKAMANQTDIGVIYADLDLKQQQKIRSAIPVMMHQKIKHGKVG